MDNISGKANYSSDQDVQVKNRKSRVKKEVKKEVINIDFKLEKVEIVKTIDNLNKMLRDLYKKESKKEHYDAIVTAQDLNKFFIN